MDRVVGLTVMIRGKQRVSRDMGVIRWVGRGDYSHISHILT